MNKKEIGMKGKQVSLFDNVYIDHFAGGGGASTEIEINKEYEPLTRKRLKK